MKTRHSVYLLLLAALLVACSSGSDGSGANGDPPGGSVQLPPQWTATPVTAGGGNEAQESWRPCGDAPASNLNAGDFVSVRDIQSFSLRLREVPGLDSGVIHSIGPGKSMQIIEGPTCADGFVWWHVRALASEAGGWVIEGNAYQSWLVEVTE